MSCTKPCAECGAFVSRNNKTFCGKKCAMKFRWKTAPPKRVITDWVPRFLALIKESDGPCRLKWMGTMEKSKTRKNYGLMTIHRNGKYHTVTAHQAAFFLKEGRWQGPRAVICHTCDVGDCVTPEHLYEGDRFDNAEDAQRNGCISFEMDRANTKVPDGAVGRIFDLKRSGARTREIAKHIGLERRYIDRILMGSARKRAISLLKTTGQI